MVSIEELLKRVQQADTETGRQWILLELQMSQMPKSLVSMLWAAAIPHFFDENILAALRPELTDEAEKLFANLQSLTFVEEFPGYGYNIHELTRKVLLSKLWQQDREEFLLLSKRAANYFFGIKASSEEDVEFAYHEILNEECAPSERLIEKTIDWWRYCQIDRIQAVLQALSEHERAERLDVFGYIVSLYLTGLVKRYSAKYKEAEVLFIRGLEEYEKQSDKNPRYLVMLLRDISSSKSDQGDIQGAISICEQSLKICKEQLGDKHLDTASSLNNLAGLYESQGRYSEAEPLSLEALEINKVKLGERHPDTARSLNNLAALYRSQGRYSEA
ncbi:MAG: tetratricopeptide repeat protein, partial [Cyanobacteria bacterium J06573_11]